MFFCDGFCNTEGMCLACGKFTPGVEKLYRSFPIDAIIRNIWLQKYRRSVARIIGVIRLPNNIYSRCSDFTLSINKKGQNW